MRTHASFYKDAARVWTSTSCKSISDLHVYEAIISIYIYITLYIYYITLYPPFLHHRLCLPPSSRSTPPPPCPLAHQAIICICMYIYIYI